MADTPLGPDSVRANASTQDSDSKRDLNDVCCWLEQAVAMIELLADHLCANATIGSAPGLALFGVASVVERAQHVATRCNDQFEGR